MGKYLLLVLNYNLAEPCVIDVRPSQSKPNMNYTLSSFR